MRPEELIDLLGVPLSGEQLEAATAPLAPQLIVAGAGTGKTTVMAARVTWLVATHQVEPARILGLTFTNQAAAELRGRIRASLSLLGTRGLEGSDGGEPTIDTYHAFSGRILSERGMLIGTEPTALLLTDAHRARLAHRVACAPVAATGEVAQALQATPERVAEQILELDDALADLDVDPAEMRSFDRELLVMQSEGAGAPALRARVCEAAERRSALSVLVEQFRQAKHAGEYLDFADQIRLVNELTREHPAVATELRHRFAAVLLDEYQDTSRAQRRTMQTVFGAGHPVTAVGDPCQAIYGWRGASVTNIDEFSDHFPRADGRRAEAYPLSINRRSGAEVLSVANALAADLHGVHRQVKRLVPQPQAGGASVTCALLRTYDDEVTWVVDRVDETLGRGRAPTDLAILCRTNQQVADVAAAVAARGIPVFVGTTRALLQLPAVAEVVSVLRLLIDPYANPDVVTHLVGPRFRVGPRDLAALATRARRLAAEESGSPNSLLDAVFDPGDGQYSPEGRERIEQFAGMIGDLFAQRNRTVAAVIAAVSDRLGSTAVGDAASVGAMAELLRMAEAFTDVDGGRSLRDFVGYLRDCERFDAGPALAPADPGDAVTVMTIHGAKGLEFPVVLTPFWSESVFPAARGATRWPTSATRVPPVLAGESDPALLAGFPGTVIDTASYRRYTELARRSERHDEDRLAYVAVTRAREELFSSGHWWGPSQVRPRGPSTYLRAVARQCEPEAVEPWCSPPEEDEVSPAVVGVTGAVRWPHSVVDHEATEVLSALMQEPGTSIPDNSVVDSSEDVDELVNRLLADLRGRPGQEGGAGEVLSVSDLVQMSQGRPVHPHRPMPRRPSAAADRGSEFHEWVEHRLGQQALFDLDDTGAFTTAPEPDGWRSTFERSRFADRTPAAIERSFTMAIGRHVLTGQADAVFTADPENRRLGFDFELVDWKTGTSGRADPVQLAVYVRAWSAIAGVPADRIRAGFFFVGTGVMQWCDELPELDDGVIGGWLDRSSVLV